MESRKLEEFTLTRASRSHPWDVWNPGHVCIILAESKDANMHEFDDKKAYRVQGNLADGTHVDQVVIGAELLKYIRALT